MDVNVYNRIYATEIQKLTFLLARWSQDFFSFQKDANTLQTRHISTPDQFDFFRTWSWKLFFKFN